MANKFIEKLLATPFEGRVMSQDNDPNGKYSEFDGNPTIAYPWSDEGVRHAIKLKESLGRKGFLRSGRSCSSDDPCRGQHALVVDLSHFTGLEVRAGKSGYGKTVTVEAGVTNQQLADELVRVNAFLPLGDNPARSVVSGVLSDNPGYFDRSMGSLADYVEEFEMITPEGDVERVKKGEGRFRSVLEGTFGGAIKLMTFSAVTSSEAVMVMRASFVYTREDFRAAIGLLDPKSISKTMDLCVHAYHGTYGTAIVSITMAGKPGDRDRMHAVLDRLVLSQPQPGETEPTRQQKHYPDRVEASGPAEIVALILEGGLSGHNYIDRNLACRHYDRIFESADFDSVRASLIKDMTTALARGRDGRTPRVLGSMRLSLNNDDHLAVTADTFLPWVQRAAELRFNRAARRSLGRQVKSKMHVAARKRIGNRRAANVDLSKLTRVAPSADALTIPGFQGEIYAPGDPDYDAKRHQYASSSYPEKQGPDGSMHPHLIAYPRKGTDDMATAINYARDSVNRKYVVARSGGHQYCGLSSGGNDTILLSMDLFNDLEVTTSGDKIYARVGVGKLLTDIASEFNENGVTIPHGECPRVGIGGHVQTGGYGHLLRSYGLALDHVHQFKIYLHDGTLQTVQRPSVRDENGLFWGVLGGGPGSFGILTEITFECIRDSQHPHSWGYAGTFFYKKALFQRAMNEIKAWTEMVATRDSKLPPDVDMCMTVASHKALGHPIYLLEMVHGNKDGQHDGGRNVRFLKAARDRILDGKWAIPCLGFEGDETLSYMSNAFVRRNGTTVDGREFPDPYKKRLNCTTSALQDGFIDKFVDLVDDVAASSKVLLVFQMFIGGGAYASPVPSPPLNSICHRDVTLGIVFDCFYKRGGLQEAERFQQRMRDLLASFSGSQEVRMLWGSFGDTNIKDPAVRKVYYDDTTWQSLQRQKAVVDPRDLFHTEFTVQLP